MTQAKNSWVATQKNIAITFGGKTYTFQSDNPAFLNSLGDLRNEDYEAALTKLNPVWNMPTNLPFKCQHDVVTYQGRVLPTALGKKLMGCARNGAYKPFLAFWNKLNKNPSFRAQKELYQYLSMHQMPLFRSGDFLGWKAVREDFTDKHTGTILNKSGTTVKTDRWNVDDNSHLDCSCGYHIGSPNYVREFADKANDRIMEVRVNPTDVITVPTDSNCQKIRVCSYRVLKDITKEFRDGSYKRFELEVLEAQS